MPFATPSPSRRPRSSACSPPRARNGLARPPPRRATQQPARRRARRAATRRCRPTISNISTPLGARGDGRGGHRRGAPPRRLLRAAGNEEAAARTAPRPPASPMAVATDCNPGTSPLLSPDAGDEHGVHLVRADPRRSARRDDHQRRPRARPRPGNRHASTPARPPTCACGGSRIPPNLATGSAMPGPERRIVAGLDA